MSRSTWACELKYAFLHFLNKEVQSRSTWACELKLLCLSPHHFCLGHAPRERVSWNNPDTVNNKNRQVTLHVSVWVEIALIPLLPKIDKVTLHVSVWVEITNKSTTENIANCHAPRERVSWNVKITFAKLVCKVTLHVSVWVEIPKRYRWCITAKVTLHVSVWVEIIMPLTACTTPYSHAPRERVSWNLICF